MDDPYLRAQAADDLQGRIAAVRGTGYDEDRMVRAAVSGTGALVDLTFHPAAHALGPVRLGEAIVEAAQLAQADAKQRAYTLMALSLGDDATAIVERSEATGLRPPAPRQEDDDLASFDASIFRSNR